MARTSSENFQELRVCAGLWRIIRPGMHATVRAGEKIARVELDGTHILDVVLEEPQKPWESLTITFDGAASPLPVEVLR